MRHGSPWCCYVRHGQILRNTPKRDHQGGSRWTFEFGVGNVVRKNPVKKYARAVKSCDHWQFCDWKKRWLSWQGTFESKGSAGLWIKWSSFGICRCKYIHSESMRIICESFQRFRDWDSSLFTFTHIFPWGEALDAFDAGWLGCWKRHLFKGHLAEFQVPFFWWYICVGEIHLSCVKRLLMFTSILSWSHLMWWFPCDDLKHFE